MPVKTLNKKIATHTVADNVSRESLEEVYEDLKTAFETKNFDLLVVTMLNNGSKIGYKNVAYTLECVDNGLIPPWLGGDWSGVTVTASAKTTKTVTQPQPELLWWQNVG